MLGRLRKSIVWFSVVAFPLLFTVPAHAQHHAGQVDSDGVLSPGEIQNPLIHYRGSGRGDYYGRPSRGASPVDTDGHLARGELPNPLINYSRYNYTHYDYRDSNRQPCYENRWKGGDRRWQEDERDFRPGHYPPGQVKKYDRWRRWD